MRYLNLGRRLAPVMLGLAVVVAAAVGASPARGASPVVYVDGKSGSDSNSGTTPTSALKTVKAGLWLLRYGGRLEVAGYNDYVYYETMTGSQWFINGTATSPVVITAKDYGTSGYVRPIISGALVVSTPGSTTWSQPDPVNFPDVWSTPWTTPVAGYESSVNVFRQERVFVDTSVPLIRPKQTPTLADLQASPGSQFWDGSRLYVRLGGWGTPGGDSLNPNDHLVEIPHYKGILIASGSQYVRVQGFRVRHTTMGVGFTGTAHHNTVEDVDASYNYSMGFFTASSFNVFRNISGTRNTIQLVKLDNGAQYNLVEGAVGVENLGQGIKLTGSNTAYNTVRYSTFSGGRSVPMAAAQYGGYVQGIDIEQGAHHNTIWSNTIENNRRGLMLYQLNRSGGPLTGNVVKYNLFKGNDVAVVIWDGRYSAYAGSGKVTFARNTYAWNRNAVMTESTTSRKRFNHETFYATGSSRTVGHSTFYVKAGTLKVVNSIVFKSKGYAFYVKKGRVDVLYTTIRGTGLGKRRGNVVFGTGVVKANPAFLSLDAASGLWLTIDKTSPVYTKGKGGTPLGARWK